MQVADSNIQIAPLAAIVRPPLVRQAVPLVFIAGVTWLAMMGVVVSSYIVGHPLNFVPAPYTAYDDISTVVPTSYGSIEVTRAEMTTNDGTLTAHFSLRQVNTRDTLVEVPQVEELRIINASGQTVSRPVADSWNGPAFLPGHATTAIDAAYEAPADAGPLWLEYHNVRGKDPIRFALKPGADR